MSVVIDSSVTLAWFFEDERSDATDALLQQVVAEGAVVPSLWRLEIANGFQSALRRKRITVAFRDASLADLAAFPIAVDAETDRHAWGSTLTLAERHGLTPYDACYLELAQRLRLPLASLDRELRAASRALRVALKP
ncbi:MAG: type II toxin-antitoxin system VapC family toxin [Proteobacteria bacterium]|jgi:predicted nucleic acid-binding protein|nr:type II toxin-antitoxin system VapC family toxin [Pseudomonadota bacterium]